MSRSACCILTAIQSPSSTDPALAQAKRTRLSDCAPEVLAHRQQPEVTCDHAGANVMFSEHGQIPLVCSRQAWPNTAIRCVLKQHPSHGPVLCSSGFVVSQESNSQTFHASLEEIFFATQRDQTLVPANLGFGFLCCRMPIFSGKVLGHAVDFLRRSSSFFRLD